MAAKARAAAKKTREDAALLAAEERQVAAGKAAAAAKAAGEPVLVESLHARYSCIYTLQSVLMQVAAVICWILEALSASRCR